MPAPKVKNRKNLIRRYLIWCYKTTKEELDRIDRKFTQLEVDYFALKELTRGLKAPKEKSRQSYLALVGQFKDYLRQKENDSKKERTSQAPRYLYLKHRLSAIEKAAVRFLGKQELNTIVSLYESEMTQRILEAREHT